MTVLSNCCILQFAKLPELGKVKTRMQPQLSTDDSLALHCDLTQHAYKQLAGKTEWAYELWVGSRGGSPDYFDRLQRLHASSIHLQKGKDLGERMAHALEDALERYDFAIVIGSDCPQLTDEHLSSLITHLQSGVDGAVIPATDGGYVALGLRRFSSKIFEGVDWGSSCVLAQTLARFDQLQWSVELMPALADIDHPEDLSLLSDYPWGKKWSDLDIGN